MSSSANDDSTSHSTFHFASLPSAAPLRSSSLDANNSPVSSSPLPSSITSQSLSLSQFPSWWRRWWQQLSTTRQDHFAMLAPLLSVAIFMVAIVAAFGYLRIEEIEREQETIKRDVEYAQQRLRLRLLERQEQLMRFARDIGNREISAKKDFTARAEALITNYPELQILSWVDHQRLIKVVHVAPTVSLHEYNSSGTLLQSGETTSLYNLAQELQQPIYSQPLNTDEQPIRLQLHIPMQYNNRFTGALIAEFSIDALLRYGVPNEILAKYAMTLLDHKSHLLAGTVLPPPEPTHLKWRSFFHRTNEFQMPVAPIGHALILHAQAWRTSQGLINSGLFWMLVLLSTMTAWMLIANWQHTRRRVRAQEALVAETLFRRAMENSMLTGMRAMDMQSRITYVNAAFCQMTGWSEEELVGQTPPFSYWPEDDHNNLAARLRDELSGKTAQGGFQVRIRHKNGDLFDVRLYVSPLIDPYGNQTGWMTSVTDITEPNRIREQLTASHERFTIVLEALDASVSVAPLGSEELLFANKLYRLWFGSQTTGHLKLLAQAGGLPIQSSKQSDADESNNESNQPNKHSFNEKPAELPSTDAADNTRLVRRLHSGSRLDHSLDDEDGLMGLPTASLTIALSENAEIFVPELGKWLEVRSRYLNWVDGRLAQMVIATDITPRRQAEELAAAQAERAQSASRLITMGEMASSVAHELNQPLTAITNYCSGIVTRIKNKSITEAMLLTTLEKTVHQSQRAGQIISRIRSFVKRSEPNRSWEDAETLISEAVELAEIELRRRNVRLSYFIAARLPKLWVDPILIEQVLINLLKNAAESIDNAQRPSGNRQIELRVVPKEIEIQEQKQEIVEFCVTDTGRGLSPEVRQRLFEAFYSTKAEGMGIGLNLCRSIVESHAGRMSAENLYNANEISGCRFIFWLPVTKMS